MKIQTFHLTMQRGRQTVPDLLADAVLLSVVKDRDRVGRTVLRVSYATDGDEFWKRSRQFIVLRDGEEDKSVLVGDAHHVQTVVLIADPNPFGALQDDVSLHVFEVKYEDVNDIT